MSISVRAKTRDNIQVYASCIASNSPNIQSYESLSWMVTPVTITAGSNNDVNIFGGCSTRYLFIAVWDGDIVTGPPASWVVIDLRQHNTIVAEDKYPYTVSNLTGNASSGFSADILESSFYSKYNHLLIPGAVILVIFIVIILVTVFIVRAKSRKRGSKLSPTAQAPLFPPAY